MQRLEADSLEDESCLVAIYATLHHKDLFLTLMYIGKNFADNIFYFFPQYTPEYPVSDNLTGVSLLYTERENTYIL